MFPLFETLRVKDGIIENIEFHLKRVSKSRKIFWGHSRIDDFAEIIKSIQSHILPELDFALVYKLKIEYDSQNAEFSIQTYKQKKITHLIPVEADDLEYSLKFSDRSRIEELLQTMVTDENLDNADIIIIKNGNVTDSSYTNLVFEKKGKFYTPSDCLLEGTKRAKYLSEGIITEKSIKVNEINQYDSISLINSMLDLGNITIKLPLNIP